MTRARVRTRLLTVAALAAVAPLSSCGLLDGGGHLEDALEVLPAGTTRTAFLDRERLSDRLDLDDVDADSATEELDERWSALAVGDASGLVLSLLSPAHEGLAFSEGEVVWVVSAYGEHGPVTVLRFDDDVDLDDVGDRMLDDGYVEDTLAGRRHFTPGPDTPVRPQDIGGYPAGELVLEPDEGLMILGPGTEGVLAVVDGDADPLADEGAFDGLLDDGGDAEAALLTTDVPCGLSSNDEDRGLDRPDALAYLVMGDDAEHVARLRFDSDQAADDDAEARAALLSDSDDSFDVEADGEVVTVEMQLDAPHAGFAMASQGLGFAECDG